MINSRIFANLPPNEKTSGVAFVRGFRPAVKKNGELTMLFNVGLLAINITIVQVWTIYIRVLLRIDSRTSFEVITRRTVKAHRDRNFRGCDQEIAFR